MKVLCAIISLACFAAAYADVVPYNFCADKTKTDCETLHMPSLGSIDSAAGHQTATCGDGCSGDAAFKATAAVTLLVVKAGDLDYSHYITYEANSQNVVYIQQEEGGNTYERIIAQGDDDHFSLKYCTFLTDNIAATLEKYKKEHDVQAGASIIDKGDYNSLKTAFQAQEDATFCADLK